jgi:hypothetical protein
VWPSVGHTQGVDDVLWIVIPVLACAGMLVLAHRIEPHWVAKDGARFLTTTQVIDGRGETVGRRREMRFVIQPDGTLVASRRGLVKTSSQTFTVGAKSPNPPRGRALYLLDSLPPDADGRRVAIRVPATSRVVPALDRMVGLTP